MLTFTSAGAGASVQKQSLHLFVDNQRLNRYLKYKCLYDFKEKLVTRHILTK